MKILYVTPRYYPHTGGVEYVVKSVAERFARRGYEVIVIAGEPRIRKPREAEVNAVHVIRWPTYAPRCAYHVPRMRRDFAKLVREYAKICDVIHVHGIHALTTYYTWRSIRDYRSSRFVITLHYHGGGHSLLSDLLWIPYRYVVSKMLDDADVIHCVSRYEATLVKRHYHIEPVIVEHGIDEDILKYAWQPRNYIMYAGRIEKYKNVDLLAKVVSILNRRYNMNLKLLVIGNGSYREKLAKKIKKLGIDYEMLPFQPREKYLELLSGARAFALLSRKEAYGLATLEAMVIGVPVIVAKPWGENFAGKTRVLIVSLDRIDEEIAGEVARFLEKVEKEEKPMVPTWDQVIDLYIKHLYSGALS